MNSKVNQDLLKLANLSGLTISEDLFNIMVDLVRSGVPPDFIVEFLVNNYKNTKLLRSFRKGIEKKNQKEAKDH